MSVQRYGDPGEDYELPAHPDGFVVLYADHVAALAEAETISSKVIADFQRQARAEALRQAREVVAGLPWKVAVSFGPIDCDESCEHGPCTCSGVMRPEAWMTGPADALAAIDALAAGQAPAAPEEKP